MQFQTRSIFAAATLSLGLIFATGANGMAFSQGDLYSSNYFSNTIKHYDSGGGYIDSINLSASSDVRGLSFGTNGMLYAVSSQGSGFNVFALDSSGGIHESYSGSGYTGGNLSSGKITFGTNNQFYVAAGDGLVRFTTGVSAGSIIYSNNQVFDSVALPSGNLLVLSAYSIQEITPSGLVVRSITPDISLTDARGIEYDPATNAIFVTMLGHTGEFFQLMRINGVSVHVEAQTTFVYGDDLALASGGRLIVGSRTQAPGIFDMNLNQVGTLTGGQQMFVTQMPATVPVPATAWLMGSGLLGLLGVARKRKTA